MTDQIEYSVFSTHVGKSRLSSLGDIYRSSCTQECLDLFSKYLKEDRDNLLDHKEYLAGVAYKQLSLFNEGFPREINRIPLDLFELFKLNLDAHITNIFGGQVGWILESIWVNIMLPGDFQPLHRHTGSLSYVWYIDVPQIIYRDNDEYERKEPDGSSPYGEIHFHWPSLREPNFLGTRKIRPETGDLLIFDASHQHVVYPFKEPVERISISGNIRLGNSINSGLDGDIYEV